MIKKWLRGKINKKEPTTHQDWRTDNSILKYLRSNLDENGFLLKTAFDLPEENKDDDKLIFAAGLADYLFGEKDSEDSSNRVAALSKHLKTIATTGDHICEQEFYRLCTEDESVIGIIDEFVEKILNDGLHAKPYLFNFAKDLATKSISKNAVKFGIAILGICQDNSVLDDIKILALHDEFTLFGAIAIVALSENAADDLWELVKKVDGWGKIQLVERLVSSELKQPFKDWLIMDGYKNSIMYEYLAFICAIHGELHIKLEEDQIDHELFKASSDIIESLLEIVGPAEDITTYPYAAQVIQDFIRHAKTHTTDISDFYVLNKIKDYLTTLQDDIGEQEQNGWTEDIISNCLIDIVEILNRRDWKMIANEGLKSDDNNIFWHAKKSAERLGIDLWETVRIRVETKPLKHNLWYDIIQYSKPEHADEIIESAIKLLPLDEMATGPKDSMGMGANYHKFSSLDTVTTYLEKFPGKGEKIILTSLNCPVTRNRNMAINVLNKWGKENWTPKIQEAIKHLQKIEPNAGTKENIQRLLRGEELG